MPLCVGLGAGVAYVLQAPAESATLSLTPDPAAHQSLAGLFPKPTHTAMHLRTPLTVYTTSLGCSTI